MGFTEPHNERWGDQAVTQEEVLKSLAQEMLGKEGAPGYVAEAPQSPQIPVRTGSLADRPAVPVGGGQSSPPAPERAVRASLFGATATGRATGQAPAPTPAPGATPTAAPAPQGPPTSAYAMGAPSLDDRTDAFGRPIAGAQTFVRGLFAAADNANKALADYKKRNPNATATSDDEVTLLHLH